MKKALLLILSVLSVPTVSSAESIYHCRGSDGRFESCNNSGYNTPGRFHSENRKILGGESQYLSTNRNEEQHLDFEKSKMVLPLANGCLDEVNWMKDYNPIYSLGEGARNYKVYDHGKEVMITLLADEGSTNVFGEPYQDTKTISCHFNKNTGKMLRLPYLGRADIIGTFSDVLEIHLE